MKVNKFKDIPKFTNEGSYAVDMEPAYLLSWIEEEKEYGLELNPDFQRGHVWNEEQQRSYIEYVLRGGKTGRDLYFNCPEWNSFRKMKPGKYQDYVCVDGLQRITAWQAFFEDKIQVFGSLRSEFTDRFPHLMTMRVHINDLKTRKEVLQWYIEMNSGGVVHTKSEIDRVKELLNAEG